MAYRRVSAPACFKTMRSDLMPFFYSVKSAYLWFICFPRFLG